MPDPTDPIEAVAAGLTEAETGVYSHGNMMYGPSVPPLIAAKIRALAGEGVG